MLQIVKTSLSKTNCSTHSLGNIILLVWWQQIKQNNFPHDMGMVISRNESINQNSAYNLSNLDSDWAYNAIWCGGKYKLHRCPLRWLYHFKSITSKDMLCSKSVSSKWNGIICKWGGKLMLYFNDWLTDLLNEAWLSYVAVLKRNLPLNLKIYLPMTFIWQKKPDLVLLIL